LIYYFLSIFNHSGKK